MKRVVFSFFLLLLILPAFKLFASESSFISLRGFIRNSPSMPVLYGAYDDPAYSIDSSDTKKPDLLVGAGMMYARYFGDFQLFLNSNLAYTGGYISKVGINPPEDTSYLFLEAASDAQIRYFAASNFSVYGGVRYIAMFASGNYPSSVQNEQTQQKTQSQTQDYEKFMYWQYAPGYGGGFHIYPELFRGFNLYLAPSYYYFPEDTANQVYKMYGTKSDTNKSHYILHNFEIVSSFSLKLYPGSNIEAGLISRMFYFMNTYDDEESGRIHPRRNFVTFDVAPFIEFIIPLQ